MLQRSNFFKGKIPEVLKYEFDGVKVWKVKEIDELSYLIPNFNHLETYKKLSILLFSLSIKL